MTKARRTVLQEVFSRHRHFDADDLYFHMKDRQAGVSRATVYRTLTLLVSSGLVNKMGLGGGRSIYEHVLGHSHHDHLICLKCGRILEFHHPDIEDLQKHICHDFGFVMHSHTQQIYGICKECRTKESA